MLIFLGAGHRKYGFGIVVTHDGKEYKYTVFDDLFSAELFGLCVEKYAYDLYNGDGLKAQKRVIEESSERYGISCVEL